MRAFFSDEQMLHNPHQLAQPARAVKVKLCWRARWHCATR